MIRITAGRRNNTQKDLPKTMPALYRLGRCSPTKSCRVCMHGLIRDGRNRSFNYEACALGVLPMIPVLPFNWRCELWKEKADGN